MDGADGHTESRTEPSAESSLSKFSFLLKRSVRGRLSRSLSREEGEGLSRDGEWMLGMGFPMVSESLAVM